jgi:putative membrane protein
MGTRRQRSFLDHVFVLGFIVAMSFVLVAARRASPKAAPVAKDQEFATNAASGGMLEVKLGELAQSKGSNPAVKEFGARMVRDHSKAGDELKGIASSANVTLPTGLTTADQDKYHKLSRLSGTEFDKEYARDMVADHEHDIAEFRRESTDGQNEPIKHFAAETLPTLQSHLDQARQMLKAVESGS